MDFIAGISIGSSKVAISLGYINKYFDIQLLGSVSKKHNGIENGTIIDREQIIVAVKSCKKTIEDKYDIKMEKGLLCIPSYICELEKVESKLDVDSEIIVTQNQVDNLYEDIESAMFEGKTALGLASEKFIVNGENIFENIVGRKANSVKLNGYMVVADKAIIKEYVQIMKLSDIKVESISLEPITESYFFTEKQKDKNIVLLNVGAQKTTINLFEKNKLVHSTYINIGGNIITNDISKCVDISIEESENLKITKGAVRSDAPSSRIATNSTDKLKKTIASDYLNQIIEARVYEIFKYINKTLENLKSSYNIEEVVLFGGGISLFEGIVELANEVFGCEVKSIKDISVEAYNPIYTASIGIVKESFNLNYKEKNVDLSRDSSTYSKKDEKKDVEKNFLTKIKSFIKDFF